MRFPRLRSGLAVGFCALACCAAAAFAADPVNVGRKDSGEAGIPVAGPAGVAVLSQKQYERDIEQLGHLPSLSKSYVFGHKIPRPKTDKAGHILVSRPASAAPCDAAKEHAGTSIAARSGILAFGDSLTFGFGLPRMAAFPAQLEARLRSSGVETSVVNGGVSGETTAEGLARLDQALADAPGFVVLELGANDALRGIDPALVRANLQQIITRIRRTGAQVLLTGMLAPTSWGEEYRRAFDRVYPELAEACQVPLYPFFLAGVAMRPELNQPDGLHPNEQGAALIADRVAPVIVPLLTARR